VSDLGALRLCERAKRLFVVGAVVLFYAGGWLFFAWHASRVAETECTFTRDVYGCSVTHAFVNGEVGLLPKDDCDRPKTLPTPNHGPVPVGAKVRCFYYASTPDSVFFAPRRHAWATTGRLAFFGAGLALVALAAILRARASRERATHGAERIGPYRQMARVSPPPPRPRLVIPLAKGGGGCAVVLVGPIFFLASIASVMALYVTAWDRGGELGAGDMVFTCLAHPFVLLGAAGLFYRSNLVLDDERGVVFHEWGLRRPWFRSTMPLSALERASVHVGTAGRGGRSVYLRLHFEGGRTRDYASTSDRAAEWAKTIDAYLRERAPRPAASS
jgi:hypothetical protein